MAILVFVILIVIIAFLICYAVDQAQVKPPMNQVLKVAIILVAIVLIIQKGGLL